MSMSFSTFLIGILPEYSTLGLAAPIILFILRFFQGFSVGGECNGAAIYALEHEENDRLGLKGAILIGSSVMGALVATLSGMLLSKYTYGWRISYILGALVGVVGLFMRRKLNESPIHLSIKRTISKKSVLNTLKDKFLNHRYEITLSVLIGGVNGSLYYTLFGYSNYHFYSILHYSSFFSLTLMAFGMVVFIISIISIGHLSERIGVRKTFQTACITILILIIPCFFILSKPVPLLSVISISLLAILTSGVGAPLHAFMQNMFPPQSRYLGISLGFNFGIAIFGGLTPTIFTWGMKILDNFVFLAFYPLLLTSIALIFTSFSPKNRELSEPFSS